MFVSVYFYLSLILVSICDLKSKVIPNKLVFFLVAVVLCLRISDDFSSISMNLIYASLVFLFLLFIRKITGGLGVGDIKLMFAATFCVGINIAFWALLVSCLFGIIFCLVLNALKKAVLEIPFAPFIASGFITVDLIGNRII